MQGEREQERLTDQVRQQLERFPIARQSADARKLMELYLTASAASSPNSPLSELADEVHTRIVNLTAGRTEAREQQRNENRAATKTVESAGGTPPLTPPPDINRKTNVREMAEEMLRRGGGDLAKKLGL